MVLCFRIKVSSSRIQSLSVIIKNKYLTTKGTKNNGTRIYSDLHRLDINIKKFLVNKIRDYPFLSVLIRGLLL